MASKLFNATLVGDRELIQRLTALPSTVRKALIDKINILLIQLQQHVVVDKLHGQVLHQRSGRLARSIQTRIEATAAAVFGFVFSAGDVKYAAIHEFGGKTPPHDIYPVKAQALAFAVGGQLRFAAVVHHPGSQMPERSFMRSSLADQAESIDAGLRQTVLEATGLAVHGR